jgi:DNA-binding helix-hairpin-helix protein with protein kinase domain
VGDAIHSADGRLAALGRELGRGGEGVVFDLPAQPSLVAKLYHQTPDAAKQAKLRLMAEHIDSPLRDYAAWPEDTLHDESGAVIGFTMQRIEGRHPIHMLYSPAQRRETFPQARFDFLVFVARNIAAAFATLHEHGHVLGDVNQGNVLVGADSRVILIDCDSFQIQVGDELHRCPVGIAHFTPPELQSIASFEDITRTPNHDAFGLALLIFHLLMGGRHPYSGVPLAEHIGESLEADIRDFRYAYASDAAKRLIAPPPKSVPIESLPAEIVDLFEQAFSERGVESRPSPQQWVGALDALRDTLKQCAKQPLHLHAAHLADCPWCALDRRHVTLFGEVSRTPAAAPATIDVESMLQALAPRLNLPAEQKYAWPQWPAGRWETHRKAQGTVRDYALVLLLRPQVLLFGVFAVLILGANGKVGAAVALAVNLLFLWFMREMAMPTVQGDNDRGEWSNSQFRYERALEQLQQAEARRDEATGRAALERWRAAHRRLQLHQKANAKAIASVTRDVHQRGLRQTLATHLLAEIPRAELAEGDLIRLQAAGIETAADFDANALGQLHFLPQATLQALLDWRSEIAREFQRQHRAKQAPEVVAAEQSRARKQRALEQELLVAYRELQRAPADPAVLADLHQEIASCEEAAKREFNRWNAITGRWLS